MTQKEKAELFLKLHHDDEVLVILNSWDAGSSKLVEACGFKAIGTTSMGVAASLGYPDCQKITFKELLNTVKSIVKSVSAPVTVDFEGGFGNNIDVILKNTEKLIQTGIVGINIEDSIALNPNLLETDKFCERLRAIRELSNSMGIHLVINARTDVFLAQSGKPEERLTEAVKRGNKYREAGADCIFVPNVTKSDKISLLVKEIDAPVNILANPTNGAGLPPGINELRELGVARLSVGSSVMKATLKLVRNIAEGLLLNGSYDNLLHSSTPVEDILKSYQMATRLI